MAAAFRIRRMLVSNILLGTDPLEQAETVGAFYRDFIALAPEEFGVFMGFHVGPPVPFLPEEWHGKPVCVMGMWTGDLSEGESRWPAP